ncbi:MAG: UDP-glucose 4-epimerase [Hydrogenophilales bacterium 28-61-23]|nr:MAG: UDP-glucose 4-epimerase [Hydrogenophilales bacterium 28-61-23]
MSTYFLTGGTGAVGSAIVPLLMAEPDAEVRLLLRADSDASLAQRLDELIRFWGWAEDFDKQARIKALRGDAAAPQFGLGEPQYAGLVAECSHVLHCAGTVRMNLPLEGARRSAVGSTHQILGLARDIASAGHLRKVEFVSTLGVAGKRPGVLPEAWMDEAPAFHNTYEQAKFEAEAIVRAAIADEDLPVTVHRPSMVIGDARDGRIIHFQIFYFICEFLSGRKTLGLFPDFGDVRLDVIPVNWVAEAIVASSGDAQTAGRIFHLCTGAEQSPRLEELKGVVRNAFKRQSLSVPPGISLPRSWFAALARLATRLAPEQQRKSLATLPIYLDYLADQQGFGNPAYSAWLSSRNLTLPRPEDYLPRVLGYYLDARHGTKA